MENYPHPNTKDPTYLEDARLDSEFRQILCIIKQHIAYVNSAHHLSLYRRWLEKLSSSTCCKFNRNKYLIELAKQIKSNTLDPPFDKEPDIDILKKLPECDSESFLPTEPQGVIAVHTERRNQTLTEQDQCPVQCFVRDIPPVYVPQGRSVNYYQVFDDNDNCVYYPFQDYPAKPIKTKEDSSWCDLSDNSVASEGAAGDFDYDYEEMSSGTPIRKLLLKDTKFIPSDWKKTIESLQLRLTETLSQNNDFKNIIENLKTKLTYELKIREQLEAKLRISENHDKEIEIAKSTTDDQVKTLQKAYQSELQNHFETSELKIEEVKANYEMKISQLKLEYETDKREKEKEIGRLSTIIQQQCTNMSNEISALRKEVENCIASRGDDKINVLQKCISKMDRLFHKSEKEYLKQIEKLKQDLELKEKVQQIQMITQRAEIAARTSAEKQKQVDEVMNNLEIKYIKMLEFHEKQVMDSKRQDEEKIEYLTELLKKHNISFKVV